MFSCFFFLPKVVFVCALFPRLIVHRNLNLHSTYDKAGKPILWFPPLHTASKLVPNRKENPSQSGSNRKDVSADNNWLVSIPLHYIETAVSYLLTSSFIIASTLINTATRSPPSNLAKYLSTLIIVPSIPNLGARIAPGAL